MNEELKQKPVAMTDAEIEEAVIAACHSDQMSNTPGEYVLTLSEIRSVCALLSRAPVAAQASEPIGKVIVEGVVCVSFYENCQYGTALPAGTELYTAPQPTAEAVLPAPLTVSQAPNSQYAKGWNDCVSEAKAMHQQCTAEAVRNAQWYDGEPPFPQREEWFIAETTDGSRVVLRALDKEHAYDYTTADHTYLKAFKVRRWMQFPDSLYIPPQPAEQPSAAPDSEQLRREFNKGWNAAMGANEAVKNGTDPLAAIAKASAAPAAPVAQGLTDVERDKIATRVHGECSRIPGATFYNAAQIAIEIILAGPTPSITRVEDLVAELLAALKGVVAVADRKTAEFDRARAAIARAQGEQA